MNSVYIFDAVRTPRGKARSDGGLATFAPHQLVSQLVSALETRNNHNVRDTHGLVLGCVGQIREQGGNIALVSKLHSRIAPRAAAVSVNNYCASGLSAIVYAAAKIGAGDWNSALAGGVEMMSRVEFLGDNATYYTDDSLPAGLRFVPVAVAADRLGHQLQLSREWLDELAFYSQQKADKFNHNAALQRSRVAITNSDGTTALAHDECVRDSITLAKINALQPAFDALAITYAEALGGEQFPALHTIAHAPPVCDGAALCWLGSAQEGITPRAKIVEYCECGGDPNASLLAGFAAMETVLERAKLSFADIGRIEFMEAFAVTLAKFLRDYPVDPKRVNVTGGHMAKGHPLGATGAILLSTLLDALEQADERFGLLVVTGASGAGVALLIERV